MNTTQSANGLHKSATSHMQYQMSRHPLAQPEQHRGERIGWLRAAVLGANDGIVSTASLLV